MTKGYILKENVNHDNVKQEDLISVDVICVAENRHKIKLYLIKEGDVLKIIPSERIFITL